MALLETDDDNLSWPWVSRGQPEAGVEKVEAWDIAVPGAAGYSGSSNFDSLTRAIAGMSYSYAGIASNGFGSAGELVWQHPGLHTLVYSLPACASRLPLLSRRLADVCFSHKQAWECCASLYDLCCCHSTSLIFLLLSSWKQTVAKHLPIIPKRMVFCCVYVVRQML